MPEANINDRASIERAYPRDAFDDDMRSNALPNAEVLHGVRVESAPDSRGVLRLVRARQHVGEVGDARRTLFMRPVAVELAAAPAEPVPYDGVEPAAPSDTGRDYDRFIADLIAAARRFKPPEAPGRDERLKGFRGG